MGWEVCQFEETVPIGVQAEDENAPGANVGAFGHGVRGASSQVLLLLVFVHVHNLCTCT